MSPNSSSAADATKSGRNVFMVCSTSIWICGQRIQTPDHRCAQVAIGTNRAAFDTIFGHNKCWGGGLSREPPRLGSSDHDCLHRYSTLLCIRAPAAETTIFTVAAEARSCIATASGAPANPCGRLGHFDVSPMMDTPCSQIAWPQPAIASLRDCAPW